MSNGLESPSEVHNWHKHRQINKRNASDIRVVLTLFVRLQLNVLVLFEAVEDTVAEDGSILA